MTPAKIVLEPSTWAGVGLLLQAVRFIVPPQWQLLVDAATGMAGTMSVGLREKGKSAPVIVAETAVVNEPAAPAEEPGRGVQGFRPEAGGG